MFQPVVVVLVVTNDGAFKATVRSVLETADTLVRGASEQELEDGPPPANSDCVIVDARSIMKPWQLLRKLRRRCRTIPILVAEVETDGGVINWLDGGADQALPRTVILREREAVWRALVRHARAECYDRRIAYGDLVFDREAGRVWCAGAETRLTPKEMAVFDCLFWCAGDVVSQHALIDFVWGHTESLSIKNTTEVAISNLRRKLAQSRVVVVQTVRGKGYRLIANRSQELSRDNERK